MHTLRSARPRPWPAFVLTLVLALACQVTAAHAAAPRLVSVDAVDGHPSATWTLAPATQPVLIEVARSPDLGADGMFTGSWAEYGVLQPGQTSWTFGDAVAPGTYYVQLSSWQPGCPGCAREWSNVLALTVSGTPVRR